MTTNVLAYIVFRFILNGVSAMWKNFSGVMISEIERMLETLDGFRLFSALMLCLEKKTTRYSIDFKVC